MVEITRIMARRRGPFFGEYPVDVVRAASYALPDHSHAFPASRPRFRVQLQISRRIVIHTAIGTARCLHVRCHVRGRDGRRHVIGGTTHCRVT